jgi:hypothetical protein
MVVAYTVGRFQPPTIGHKSLIEGVIKAAKGGEAYVFVSSTEDADTNPLSVAQKIPVLEHMFPPGSGVTFVNTGPPCNCGGPRNALKHLKDSGKKDITLVVGGDHQEFNKGSGIWGEGGDPDSVVFLPTGGTRLPDIRLLDAANMSGTKARQLVKRKQDTDFYRAIGFEEGEAIPDAARTVYTRISEWLPRSEARKKMDRAGKVADTKKNGPRGGGDDQDIVYSADAEFIYPDGGRRKTRRRRIRKTRKNKASSKA